MAEMDFAKLPWINQVELMWRFTKDLAEELKKDNGKLSSLLMDSFAKSLLEQIGPIAMAEIISDAVRTEVRSYFQTHGVRVYMPQTDKL
jgi:hypothetical protein